MKHLTAQFVISAMLCGCSDSVITPADEAISRSRRLMDVLSTNATVRVIRETENVRTNLLALTDVHLRRDIIKEWKASLYDMRVEDLRPSDRYASIREAHRLVSWDVVGALWDIHESYESMWEIHLEALAWLDAQCKKMQPGIPQKGFDVRREREKWNFYLALVEYRESAIENLELNGFDERIYDVERARMDVVRKRFEIMIGRPVRPREEIKILGRFAKEVRARIVKERDAALKVCCDSHGVILQTPQ